MTFGGFAGIFRLTTQHVKDLFALHFSPERKRELAQRAAGLSSTTVWQDERGYTLSDRIWRQRRGVRTQIDQALKDGIATGASADDLAKALERYLVPGVRPLYGVAGDLLPGKRGAGSYPAKRLARTEISRAHAEATRWAAARTPGVIGIKYNLSNGHPKPDDCDRNAGMDNGMGPGVYRLGDIPTVPNHPNCLCYLSSEVNPDVDAVIASIRKEFGLDG